MSARKEWRWKKLVGVAESWRLLDHRGRNRCSVWPNGIWHTWDEHGTGGENSTEPSELQAREAGTLAVVRQGWALLVTPNRRASGNK